MNEVGCHEMGAITEQMFACVALLLQYKVDPSTHSCQNPETDQFSDCLPCQQSGFLYQVLMHLIEQFSPKEELKIDVDLTKMNEWLSDAQMDESFTTPLLSNVASPRNLSIQG